jgi:hypothetical protein
MFAGRGDPVVADGAGTVDDVDRGTLGEVRVGDGADAAAEAVQAEVGAEQGLRGVVDEGNRFVGIAQQPRKGGGDGGDAAAAGGGEQGDGCLAAGAAGLSLRKASRAR